MYKWVNNMKRQRGFTLIELLVTISIAVILMTVAVPGFQQFMTSNKLSGTTTDLMGGISYARSEAIKRGFPVSLCRSSNATSCAASGAWTQGWIIFLDTNGNGAVDSGDTLLRSNPPLSGIYTAVGTVNAIIFERNGSAKASSVGTIAICQNNNKVDAQAIIITRTRPRIATLSSSKIPVKEDGTEIGSCSAP